MSSIAIVSENNGDGGASRATRRTIIGLNEISEKIFFEYICNGEPENGYIQKKPVYNNFSKIFYQNKFLRNIIKKIINKLWGSFYLKNYHNPKIFLRFGNSINYSKTFNNFDIVHIFWGQTFINPRSFLKLNKPIVITLHDMWFLTGGCSYCFECKEYKNYCLNCPDVNNYFINLTKNQFNAKIKLLQSPKTFIVVTSEWMAKKVLEVGINKNKITKIMNHIPNNYKYLNRKAECRKELEWQRKFLDRKIIYFAGSISDPRKGFSILVQALLLLSKKIKSKIALQILGSKIKEFEFLDRENIAYKSLGYFPDQERQIIAYNSADLLICPSSFDNSPNVIAEAQMCGLPAIAFSNTGAAEMIESGISGNVIQKNNIKDLSKYLEKWVSENDRFNPFMVSDWANKKYGLKETCEKYINLYKKII